MTCIPEPTLRTWIFSWICRCKPSGALSKIGAIHREFLVFKINRYTRSIYNNYTLL